MSHMHRASSLLADDVKVTDWLQLIRGEYLEIPGLRLTKPQMQRLWGLDPLTCESILAALVDAKFLTSGRDETYLRFQGER